MKAAKLNQAEAMAFIVGGDAKFTLRSVATGVRFTYHVEANIKGVADLMKSDVMFFVSVLTGPDNEGSYTYIGIIVKSGDSWKFSQTKNSKLGPESGSVVAITHVINNLLAKGLTTDKLEIWHTGHCCRCGRLLTTPESVERGIGPECARIKAKRKV